MYELSNQKLQSKFLKKILTLFVFISVLFVVGCSKSNDPQKVFAKELTNSASYKVEGVMESFYDTGRKRNEFTVFYKNPDMIKVVIKSEDNSDKQIILKNAEGVYILIPAVNKNFKIQSDWPENASYPYLLQSLAKDIANDPDMIKTEDENTVTIETQTKMHTDANPVRQKIVFEKASNLPKEVLIYDENDNLYIRTVFTNIELDYNVSADEFDLQQSMTTVRLEYGEDEIVYEGRQISYPLYCPEAFSLSSENTTQNVDGSEVLSIMNYTSEETGFTIVQQFINDRDVTRYQEEKGEVFLVLGNVAILKDNSLHTLYHGVEYTVASNDLEVSELVKIVQSYMISEEGK